MRRQTITKAVLVSAAFLMIAGVAWAVTLGQGEPTANRDIENLTTADGDLTDEADIPGEGDRADNGSRDDPTTSASRCERRCEVVDAPSPGSRSILHDVVAIGKDNVWAVGTKFGQAPTSYAPLIERWNGETWSVVPSPLLSPRDGWLNGIAGSSATDIWAVGHLDSTRFLIEHWNGSTWEVVADGRGRSRDGRDLNAVAAASKGYAWAVGYEERTPPGRATIQYPLALLWDGHSWRKVSVPGRGVLLDVLIRSRTDVLAIGFASPEFSKGAEPRRILVEHWDGNRWDIVQSPSLDIVGTLTAGLSNRRAAALVGWSELVEESGELRRLPLLLVKRGEEWEAISAPPPHAEYADAVMDGQHILMVGTTQKLRAAIAEWNGTELKTLQPAVIARRAAMLQAVSVAKGGDLWAVGTYGYGLRSGDASTRSLILRRCKNPQ